ncbi:DUF4367 domain-containing protein [Cohnella endophytica]|uniref:DUF4367 domain-containing protein n=1 Tax=Cohnella endophytica TaxID=2419778 RepID=A0A494XYD5_9BACL|nr:DUF4367 domain-containing protein [Cohnella endophytica]RKP53104.1 DUF4367 domain-containing protein [Cohnella endophytica]
MSNGKFDRLFDASFDAAFENAVEQPQDQTIVDHRPSWQKVRHRIAKQRSRTRMISRLSKLAIVAASILVGAAIFGNVRAVRAIEPMYATLMEYPSGIMGFIFGRDEDKDESNAKTLPPPDYFEGLDVEQVGDAVVAKVTREQASKLLSFRAPTFNYIPEGVSFKDVTIDFFNKRDRADQVRYNFENKQGVVMYFQLINAKYFPSFGYSGASEGVTVKSIKLSNATGILTTSGNRTYLEVFVDGVGISMSCPFPSEEVIRIYENMFK